ncbi:MAG: hypothetical protein COA73_04305 [Candidatus Hydrogenedentota bacterium]|nr:MAG: hypothetical protein COA73_04305 [Candidatus Hydrogenedentota bacterium]
MTRMSRSIVLFIAVIVALAISGESIHACATCFGAEGSPQTQAMNAAIITMLGVTYTLFMGIAATGYFLWRRSLANSANSLLEDTEEGINTHD